MMNFKKIISGVVLAATLLLGSAGAEAATRYIRTDGGSSSQCNGSADAAYPGSGTGQNCAWNLSAGFSAHQGGDTVIIKNGTYPITSQLLAVKDGTTSNPTRIVGEQYGNCRRMPVLWANNGGKLSRAIDLTGTANVRVECIELTDHSACHARKQAGAPVSDCTSTSNYMSVGIWLDGSSNVTLRDLYIHGIANGVRGAASTDMTWERVRMYAVHESGFNGSLDRGNNVTEGNWNGALNFTDVEIAFAGCSDDYPYNRINWCVGQQGGGYGDAFGTYYTSGVWTFNRISIHHSTQDGLDLRYTTEPGADVIVKNSWFYMNAGNQVKVFTKLLMENSYVNGYCGYYGTRYNNGIETCRADGQAVVVLPNNCTGVCTTIRYSTITGNGLALLQFTTGGSNFSGYQARIENNVLVGATAPFSGSGAVGLLSNASKIPVNYFSNSIYRTSTCPSGSSCVNPNLRDISVITFDPRPATGSPVLGAGNKTYTTPAIDIRGKTRPAAPARGAFELN